jgi:hypothetical protein
MTSYLFAHKMIRIFDYPQFAKPLRAALRENAKCLASLARIGQNLIS